MDRLVYYLELSPEPIIFDAVSQLTNVFFDDSNRQVNVYTPPIKTTHLEICHVINL